MTLDPNTYLGKITSYWRPRPNYNLVIKGLTDPYLLLQDLIRSFPSYYDIDTAIGKQLDVLGEWVGQSRQIDTPIAGIYFSWSTTGLGWGQGVWKGPFDPLEGLTNLDDTTYRFLLKAKIAANQWDGSMPGAKAVLANVFNDPSYGLLFIQDNQDMSISFGISQKTPPTIQWALLVGGYIPIKPMDVAIKGYYQITVQDTPLFGWGMDNEYVAGWGEGSWGRQTDGNASAASLVWDYSDWNDGSVWG